MFKIEDKYKYQGSGKQIIVENPCTGQVIDKVNTFTEEEAKTAIERAKNAQKKWGKLGIENRIKALRKVQHLLANDAEELCELIATENGKPFQEAMQTEIVPTLTLSSYFLRRGKKILADKRIPLHLFKYRRSFINYRPRGIVLIISPWNYPFSIPNGTVIMSLIAGNAVVHKPASLTPLIALKTKEIFDKAGIDPDLYQVIPSSGPLGSKMIEMGVDYVNFTGSTDVGLKVSEICSRLLIPCSMELGGKDAAIICEDADIDKAAASVVFGALTNSGQTCASVERVYAHKFVYDKIVENVVDRVKKFRVGNPLNGNTDMGPIVDIRQLEIIEKQVDDAVKQGAKILVGGKRVKGDGQFFEPTVMVDVTEDMSIIAQETFGPVIPIMKVESNDEAIQKANNSIYGLCASVFTTNPEKGRQIAKRLEAGTVLINEVLITFAMPETPWQGVKMSGTGKTHSDDGLRNLCYPYHINEEGVIKLKKSLFWQPYSKKMYKLLISSAKILYGKNKLKYLPDNLKIMFSKSEN
ncbi:MAG: aldehyde dehydrogenase family protein [Desulfobacterales bacterium]|nr:aldehyde dehydrogenase family protein [Desulfobacterales bacterium]